MAKNYKAELTGVFGQPVSENPTGVMQEAAFAACGLNWRYLTLEVAPANLADAFRGLLSIGMKGVNLTIPHKVAVLPLLDELSPEAALIGAVNTVIIRDGKLIGENTDGKGFLRGLKQDAAMDPAGKSAVILGAGGASRAIAAELLLAGAAQLHIVNRGEERGLAMVEHLKAGTGKDITFETWTGTYLVPSDVDVLVNATSIGLYPHVNDMPDVSLAAAKRDLLVCDAVFNPPMTPLLALAKDRGMPILDGLSMLVYQGAIGFELWTGHRAPEAVMKDALRTALLD